MDNNTYPVTSHEVDSHSDGNGNEPKKGNGPCFLYEETPGRRHFHDDRHATGASDIDNNRYQGPEKVDKIISRRNLPTELTDVQQGYSVTRGSEQVFDQNKLMVGSLSRDAQRSVQHPDNFRCRQDPQEPHNYERLSGESGNQSSSWQRNSLDTNTPQMFGRRMTPMSPLTIDTSVEPHSVIPTNRGNQQSPFIYSHIQGPLKSPGIFVPYSDARRRELIENAIIQALAHEEESLHTSYEPFPLKEPPKPKRQISTDSNESIDNRTQNYPSKRNLESYPEGRRNLSNIPMDYVDSSNNKEFVYTVDKVSKHGDRVRDSILSIETTMTECLDVPNHEPVELVERRQSSETMSNLDVTEHTERRVPNSYADRLFDPMKRGDLNNPDISQAQRFSKTNSIANVQETPYTKNLKWVVASPNPNSITDFIPTSTKTTCSNIQPSTVSNIIPAHVVSMATTTDTGGKQPTSERVIKNKETSANIISMDSPINISLNEPSSDVDETLNVNASRDWSKQTYSERHHSLLSRMFRKEHTKNVITRQSTVSNTSPLKINEKGFIFPSSPVTTNPVLFSPQIVRAAFKPRFDSTPKTFEQNLPSPRFACESPSNRSTSIQAKPCCSWQCSPDSKNIYERASPNSSHNTYPESISDRIEKIATYRPVLSTEKQSTLNRSTSFSNSNESLSNQQKNSYVQNKMSSFNFQSDSCIRDKRCVDEVIINCAVDRYIRSYSAIELSPSKHEIEKVRERVRSVYRSISSPAEMREFLKNMLIEDKMKEDFLLENDVFSPSKCENVQSNPRRCCVENRSYESRDEKSCYDARRRLFVDNLQPISFKGKQTARKQQYGDDLQCTNDLQDILLEMFKPRFEEDKTDLNEDNYPIYKEQVLPESSCHQKRSDNYTYNCNDPECSHSSTRYQREGSRKRKRGDLEVCVNCEEDEVSRKSQCIQNALRKVQHSGGKNCSCAKIENAILEMARDAYQKIRRMDSSEHSLDRFHNEATETREQIFDSVKVLCGIKSMCKFGRIIEDIFSGSIIFLINCPTLNALDNLWNMYSSGELKAILNDSFLSEKLKMKYDCPTAVLEVTIPYDEYRRAVDELVQAEMTSPKLNTSLSKSDTEIASVCSSSKENCIGNRSPRKKVKPFALTNIHMRSQSDSSVNKSPTPSPSWMATLSNSPFSKERKFSFSGTGDQSPRRVFQELNHGVSTLNTASPTMTKVFDFDVTITPKTSPKLKTFTEGMPWDKSSPKRKTFSEVMPWDNPSGHNDACAPKRKTIRD